MKELKDLGLKTKKELVSLDKAKLLVLKNEAEALAYNLRMKLELKELKQTHFIPAVRKYIARINTYLKAL